MKNNPTGPITSDFSVQRLMLLVSVISFAALIMSALVALKSNQLSFSNAYCIATIAAAAVFMFCATASLISSCCRRSQTTNRSQIKKNFGRKDSSASIILYTLGGLSLIATSVCAGLMLRDPTVSLLPSFAQFMNNPLKFPLAIAFAVSAAVLACTIIALALKHIIAPDLQNHVTVIGTSEMVDVAARDECENLMQTLGLEPSHLSSLNVISFADTMQQQLPK
ncbi:hypothetical protein ECHLIB_0115 [Ehrlichia chaffeensis str. Liberty]|uniref:hypothetical protein n=1 Tax=Ehrlichia chaffeensis TaxID=945 RepID=UPI000444E643|nr:hypothetical protein [Ehrlichia chaffeensis]AHX06196.1 hypothetical protein ECHLIB_0115 [Ehrlichia chaffeensis str. Liberty]